MTRIRPNDVPAELRRRIANGCGGEGSIFRLPPVLAEPEACEWHDVAYAIGGTWWDRFKADAYMLAYWLKRVFQVRDVNHRLVARLGIAFGSFLMVRAFGWRYFRYGNPRGLNELEMLAERTKGNA